MTTPFIHARYPLPKAVDFRKSAGLNDNQLGSNSCTAFATLSTAECFIKHHGNIERHFSQRHNYFYSRQLTGTFPNDVGAKGVHAVQAAEDRGMADESAWPFESWGRQLDLNTPPPENIQTTKARFVSLVWDWRMGEDAKIKEMQFMLAEGMPITVSAKLMWNWGDANYQGTQGQEPSFVHQIALVGYDEIGFIVENSYGGSDFLVMPYKCSKDLYSPYGVTQVGNVRVVMSDPDLLENALKPYYGKPQEFQTFMQGIATSSPNWMTFNRYLMRHGSTAESALAFCKLLGFERVSKLGEWVDKA